MKKLLITAATIAGILILYKSIDKSDYIPPKPNKIEQKVKEPKESTIKIASFNIQAFGKSKREKQDVMDVLEKIVRNFDLVAVQEVRDKTETTLPYFISKINLIQGDKYAYIASIALGRSNIKENYAFIYNTTKVEFKGKSYVYNDTNDVFEREPFIAQFKSDKFDYILVNIHTKPEDAKKEIQALEDVVKDAEKKFTDDKDVIVLGDYNADGSYFSEKITTGFRDPIYHWVIPDNLDTTVKNTFYAYDRIVFRKQFTSEDFTGEFGVFDFKKEYNLTQEMAEKISDHFPVWALFYTNKDSD
jgi:endonuclease/exonuclease/phosphatase family metal-dependent hydrolase